MSEQGGPFTPTGALRAWYSILVVLVGAIVVSAAGVVYTNHVQREADRRWCGLFAILENPGAPPTTERGRLSQEKFRELVKQFDCQEKR